MGGFVWIITEKKNYMEFSLPWENSESSTNHMAFLPLVEKSLSAWQIQYVNSCDQIEVEVGMDESESFLK